MSSPKAAAKRCPKCNLPSPMAAARCRCGHVYSDVAQPPPLPVTAPTVAVSTPAAPAPAAADVTAPTFSPAVDKLLGLEGVGPLTPDKIRGGLLGGFSALFGGLVGIYTGFNLLIPAGAALGIIWIAKRTVTGPAKHFVNAFGVQVGHLVWFIAGLLYAGTQMLGQVAFDLVGMSVLLTWLMSRPGPWPVRALLGWQTLAMLVNLLLLLGARLGSQPHRSMVAHLAVRAASVYFLAIGWRAWHAATIEQGRD